MKTAEIHTPAAGSIQNPRPVHGGHAVAVAFSVWHSQPVKVTAASVGGRGDKPHVVVWVGECLTYVYDREALRSHVDAWREAAKQNTSVRLPAKPTASGTLQNGQDLALVRNVYGRQWHAVLAEQTSTGSVVITVAVGAVTVRVHSAEALRSYLLAWTRAEALGSVFDSLDDVMTAAPGY